MPKRLEEILRQKEFSSLEHKAHLALLLGGHAIAERNQALFQSFGITSQQFNVLRILRGQYPEACCQLVIKERIIDKASDVSRLVERLRKAQLVDKAVDTNDKRYAKVRITEKGLAILSQIDQSITPEFMQLGDLSPEELAQLISLVERIL